MKYQDLIQFDSLERVVELTKSGTQKKAQELVSNYVISNTMADRLINIVFHQLQYDNPADNMGLLIVGNYGTGKSHLMAVISAIAADAGFVPFLRNKQVAEAAKAIAGKFKVIRAEIGGVKTSLRDIIAIELEKFLLSEGIDFKIPPEDRISNNKDWLEDMMAAFNAKYPDQGLLFVLDELLDYLGTRKNQQLVLDFGILREIGEICKTLRIRFVAGIQEAIFDSLRFASVSDSLRRVHQRFSQVDIARNDVKFVVAERLLRKTPEQQQMIREYLEKFAPFYSEMAARLDDFVRMFPVHPDYIEIFERVSSAEKRMVLRTLSEKMSSLLGQDVPEDYPGIIAYDSYWETLQGDASFRTNEEFSKVMECASVLTSKINYALAKPYRPMAQRIINGLAVNRLTTGNIYNNIGVTAVELRDTLCLFDPMVRELGGNPDDTLRTQIELIMHKIRQAVSGQFISQNPDNHQYYIDVQRTEDIDALIEQRAAMLDDEKLDDAYFEAMKTMMEVKDVPTRVSGYNIWEYDKIIWLERQAPRIGYLFFGAPNDRSTAQPPRDYYIYFLRHFSPGKFKDEKRADEVFFRLKDADDVFENAVRNYAGALDLYTISSGASKTNYEQKVRQYQTAIISWLREKNTSVFEIVYQGQKKNISDWLKGHNLRELAGISDNERINFRDMVNTISAFLMAQNFASQAPDYPVFKTLISRQSRSQAVSEAMRVIADGRSKAGMALLDALNLLDVDRISTGNSIYAKRVLAMFRNRGAGQVINRDELIKWDHGVEYFDLGASRLEPDFLVVVLAALVCTGEITLSIVGQKFDATGLSLLAATPLEDLINFKHIDQPKDWNLPGLVALFKMLELPEGYASIVTQGKSEPVQKLQARITELVEQMVHLQNNLRNGLHFLGVDLLAVCGCPAAGNDLNGVKEFLEYMQNFDNPSKLKQFKQTPDEISTFAPAVARLAILGKLWNFYHEESQVANYIQSAATQLPPDNLWVAQQQSVRQSTVQKLSTTASAEELLDTLPGISRELHKLKRDYITTYRKMHQSARMTVEDETKRNKLLKDPRMNTLQELTGIEILPRPKLADLLNKLNSLSSCTGPGQMQLEASPVCPNCNYSPVREGTLSSVSDLLNRLDAQLDDTLTSWTRILLNNLSDPVTEKNESALKPEEMEALQEFKATTDITCNANLIPVLKQLFNGLTKVTLTFSDLEKFLKPSSPAKPDELRDRMLEYLNKLLEGNDPKKVRIVIE